MHLVLIVRQVNIQMKRRQKLWLYVRLVLRGHIQDKRVASHLNVPNSHILLVGVKLLRLVSVIWDTRDQMEVHVQLAPLESIRTPRERCNVQIARQERFPMHLLLLMKMCVDNVNQVHMLQVDHLYVFSVLL